MKLIQLNIWQGRLIALVCKFLAEQQPDFVNLQEVYSSPQQPELYDVFRFGALETIKTVLPGYFCYFSPTYDMQVFDQTIHYGNVMFSKYPFAKTETFFINGERETVTKFQLNNMRNLQRARIQLDDGRAFTLLNHHGFWAGGNSLGNEQTMQKMSRVAELLHAAERPVIFAGDLNITPVSPALKKLDGLGLRNLTVEHSITRTLSRLHRADVEVACDYIFVSPEIRVQDFTVSEELVSDHKALILEFDL